MTTKFETREEAERRREKLILGVEVPTGFDLLLEQKRRNLEEVEKLVVSHPTVTRKEIARKLHISLRTVTRYLVILRKKYKKKFVLNPEEKQIQEKKERIKHLKLVMKKHPEYSRTQLRKVIGVSAKTLISYLREIG